MKVSSKLENKSTPQKKAQRKKRNVKMESNKHVKDQRNENHSDVL